MLCISELHGYLWRHRRLRYPAAAVGGAAATGGSERRGGEIESIEDSVKHTIVDKVRMLRSVPLLSEVATEVLADLAGLSRVESHDGGAVLFAEGEPADAFFLIIDGEVSASRGAEVSFVARKGEELGALAVLDERPRAFTATTVGPSLLLRIGAEDFVYLLEQHPGLARGVIRYLAREVRSTIHGTGRYLPAETEGLVAPLASKASVVPPETE